MLVGEPTVPPQNWVKLLSAFFVHCRLMSVNIEWEDRFMTQQHVFWYILQCSVRYMPDTLQGIIGGLQLGFVC